MRPNLPRLLEFLTPDQIKSLHGVVLTILDETGVRVQLAEALEIYAAAGCQVDFDRQIVRIPEQVLSRALATAPSDFTLHASDPRHDVHVSLEDVYTIAGSSALNVLDLDGIYRPAVLQDLVDFTRLIDALEMADVMHAMVVPQDIPQPGFDRILFSTILQNTTKHYYSQGMGGDSVRDQAALAAVVQGSERAVREKPCFSMVVCFISPLVHPPEMVEEILECARLGIPLWLEATNMMGATAPVTIAGALVEHTANVLAGVVLAQLVQPGHPCVFSIASGGFNMRTGGYVAASPEAVRLHCATAQMARYYGLPFQGGSGLDACIPDAQAGYERMAQALTMSLAGVNFIHLAFGMMDQLVTSSYAQAVIDNEIFTSAFQIGKGIEVSPETIALDQLQSAGPGGQFFNTAYTRRNFRKHQWQPGLTSRLTTPDWQRLTGGKDTCARATDQARKILAEHHPNPLSAAQAVELDRLAREFQQKCIEKVGSG